MSTTLSVQEAKSHLTELVARAAESAEPCYIAHNGEPVAVLVGLREWQRRGKRDVDTVAPRDPEQEKRIRAYQRRLRQLGPTYWLPASEQARLKELVDREDADSPLTLAERKELRLLLKRHEQLMVKRASAMQAKR
ncbi:MAG: type II toxin-antitoxin system Phd/YefM family antitoxin [Armatimonadetes bacterium]|nr:type II toxin-antitoxin system Phd/YefM family antitoxin [Armatimonadota bacterium]